MSKIVKKGRKKKTKNNPISRQQKVLNRKVKNLWIIDRDVLGQMKYQKSATSREMGDLLDFPTHKSQPRMSYVMNRMKKNGLLRYNKRSRKYSLTALGHKIERKIR